MKNFFGKSIDNNFASKPANLQSLSEKDNKLSISSALKIGSVFAGAILGAGFAGGQEIVTFFVRFGKNGIFASIFAGLMFMFLGTLIIHKAKKDRSFSYSTYLKSILPEKTSYLFAAISEMFLFICFIIMLSGAGALFNECFNLPGIFGNIFTALISFLVLRRGMNGIGSVCSILTPIMITGILFVDLFSLTTSSVEVSTLSQSSKGNFLFSALLYVSYNMLSASPVLTESSTLSPNRKTSIAGGIIGGIMLSLISFFSCLALYFAPSENLLSELPLLMLSGRINKLIHYFYALVLYMAILTTAFSSGFPIVKKLEGLSLPCSMASFLLCFLSIPFSFFKFSLLVEKCYTFFGFLGLLLIGAILFGLLKNSKNS